jgi:hypothetical protein
VNVYSQPTTESLIENQGHLTSNEIPVETKITSNQIQDKKTTSKKRRKQRRKRAQLKQRTAIDGSPHMEEQIDDSSEDDEDEDENTKIYWKRSLASWRSCQTVAPEQVQRRFVFSKRPADRAIIPQARRLKFPNNFLQIKINIRSTYWESEVCTTNDLPIISGTRILRLSRRKLALPRSSVITWQRVPADSPAGFWDEGKLES